MQEEKEVEGRNKSAAFHIFADLCMFQNYGEVTAHYLSDQDLIFFEAEKPNQPLEYVLPLDELDAESVVSLVHKVLCDINVYFKSTRTINKCVKNCYFIYKALQTFFFHS